MDTILFNIPDMMCKHCAAKVEKAIKAVPGVKEVDVDVAAKTVKVTGEADATDIMQAITLVGYHPSL